MRAIYNELDAYPAQWMRNLIAAGHIAPGVVDERSISDLTAADVAGPGQRHFFAGIGVWSYALRLAGVSDDANVWTGSCPCQPFSTAGRKGGFSDERHLWPVWFELIRQCRPAVVFGEQVASPDGLKWLDAVSADLEGAGYAFGATDLCAAGVGAPHIRQRLYFVAYANGCGSGTLIGPTWERESQSDRRRATGDMANPVLSGRTERRTVTGDRPTSRRRVAVIVGDARSSRGRRDAGAVPRTEAQGKSGRSPAGNLADVVGAAGAARPLADADITDQVDRGESRGRRLMQPAPHATAGFWADAEWIPCSDGKWRPVEPGTFPLAHGATARVGRLRAYGNGLVSEKAATFIRAALTLSTPPPSEQSE